MPPPTSTSSFLLSLERMSAGGLTWARRGGGAAAFCPADRLRFLFFFLLRLNLLRLQPVSGFKSIRSIGIGRRGAKLRGRAGGRRRAG